MKTYAIQVLFPGTLFQAYQQAFDLTERPATIPVERYALDWIRAMYQKGKPTECEVCKRYTPRSMSPGDFVRLDLQWFQAQQSDWVKCSDEYVEMVCHKVLALGKEGMAPQQALEEAMKDPKIRKALENP